jgi:mRNA-degrading endonuclease toxin of MazEF toxin-antitoxin module
LAEQGLGDGAWPEYCEIYWADLNPVRGRRQAGLQPVLILSHDR